MMKIDELLACFDNGGSFGDDPEIVSYMRIYIQENRRLLFEKLHETYRISIRLTEVIYYRKKWKGPDSNRHHGFC